MTNIGLKKWHDYVEQPDHEMLMGMLHEDVVFYSPVVHTPQKGAQITAAYLSAATTVFNGSGFHYVREFDLGDRAVLEFVCEIEGITLNAVDIICWDENNLITEFKVMVRPLKAVNKLHGKMGEMLAQMMQGKGFVG